MEEAGPLFQRFLRNYHKNEVIFEEEDQGDEMFIIHRGKVKIVKKTKKGGEKTLGILKRGKFFGEMALIDNSPRSAAAIAEEDDTVFAGGILSEIGSSGNISDYMNSIQRLNTLNIEEFYPGHEKISKTPGEDMRNALKYALSLFEDSKLLFQAMASKKWSRSLLSDLRKKASVVTPFGIN